MAAEEFAKLLKENYEDKDLARKLEAICPDCQCENIKIGEGSPGRVDDSEELYRVMISPRDYDKVSNRMAQKPFEKLFSSGLSVMRSVGTGDDFLEIAKDGLWSKPDDPTREVQELSSARTVDIRQMETRDGKRKFCIYDQVVPLNRSAGTPVPTHAGIFQREILSNVDDAKRLNRDMAYELYKLFSENIIKVENFRGNLFGDLNEEARQGRYILVE